MKLTKDKDSLSDWERLRSYFLSQQRPSLQDLLGLVLLSDGQQGLEELCRLRREDFEGAGVEELTWTLWQQACNAAEQPAVRTLPPCRKEDNRQRQRRDRDSPTFTLILFAFDGRGAQRAVLGGAAAAVHVIAVVLHNNNDNARLERDCGLHVSCCQQTVSGRPYLAVVVSAASQVGFAAGGLEDGKKPGVRKCFTLTCRVILRRALDVQYIRGAEAPPQVSPLGSERLLHGDGLVAETRGRPVGEKPHRIHSCCCCCCVSATHSVPVAASPG